MRVSHLAAVATLVALLGAMFVAMGSVSAAPAGVTINFLDRDGLVSDDSEVEVWVTANSAALTASGGGVANLTLVKVGVSGELDTPPIDTDNNDSVTAAKPDESHFVIQVPKGTSPGTYVVSVEVTSDDSTVTTPYKASKELTVGDPGDAIDTVTLELDKYYTSDEDTPSNALDDVRKCGPAPSGATAAEKATEKTQGGVVSVSSVSSAPVCLIATVNNSLGKVTNDDDVATLYINTFRAGLIAVDSETGTPGQRSLTGDDAVAQYRFSVTASAAGIAVIEVDALGVGSRANDSIEITFTGNPDSLSVGAASDVLSQKDDAYKPEMTDDKGTDDTDDDVTTKAEEGGIIFEVTAADKASNDVALAPADIGDPKITDADDKDVTSKFVSGDDDNKMQKTNAPTVVQLRIGSPATAVTPGEYSVEVALSADGSKKASSTFVVAGGAAHVALTIDNATPSGDDEFVTATATVTDNADGSGNPVADGEQVTFSASGMDQILVNTDSDGATMTKDGKATATFVVVGPGRSVVSAIAGTGRDAERVESSVGAVEAEAMPEEEASVSCLSELSGFATWSCGVSADASEIFEMVSARGVSAIHLWNGSTWVRYSVVDDAMVPGSSDFMVTENDILYISN